MSFLFGGGFSQPKTNSQAPERARGIVVQASVYGMTVQKGYGTNKAAGNLIWYGDFTSVAQTSTTSTPSGGKGGGGGGSSSKKTTTITGYNYFASVAIAIGSGPISGVRSVYEGSAVFSSFAAWAGSTGFLFTGTYPQTAWSYLSSSHPSNALPYNGIAYAAFANKSLGTSPDIANYNWEVQWGSFVSGLDDADASLVIYDILTNSHDGIQFPASFVGSMTTLQNYVLAAGLVISPIYTQQQPVAQILTDLCTAINVAPIWSSGVLSFVPFGDTAVTANGHTYTPPSSPLYDLNDDDFLPNSYASGSSGTSSADPVLCTRPDQSKIINSMTLEYLDRSNNYNPATVQYKNLALITQFGETPDQSARDGHMFCSGAAAQTSIILQGGRALGRNHYQFTTDMRYIVLDPMDIITLTDTGLGMNKVWVRILEMTENDDLSLSFLAEEYLNGTGHAAQFSFSSGSGYSADYNIDPGDINTPIIFEAPVEIAPTGLEVWAVISGGDDYGGCDVWISTDGNTYKLAGSCSGQARQGFLSAILPSGSDPDTVNTLHVDLSESFGELLSGTQDNADNYQTLCYVDGELISFQTATLTSTYNYDLTYLRRGAYGTDISAHAYGTSFGRLDNQVFVYPYAKDQIGQVIYIKFLAFNLWGGGQQALSDVAAYTHTIEGPPVPGDVSGFQGQQNGNVVVFQWETVPDFALKGYDIGYAPQGSTDWNEFIILTEAAKGTEMTNAAVPPGTWTFGIRARDICDQLSLSIQNGGSFDLIVVNNEDIIYSLSQETSWLGTYVNFSLHWSGVLVPLSQHTADYYVPISAPSAPGTTTTVGGALSLRTYYVKVTLVSPSGETLASSETTQIVAANYLVTVNAPAAGGNALEWNVYIATSSGAETQQNPIVLQLSQTTWTEPVTGLISGAAPPVYNTTGWDVFNIFVPDVVTSACTYTTPTVDTGFIDTLRIWSSDTLVEGPGESGTPVALTYLDAWTTGSDPAVYIPWSIGEIEVRYANMMLSYTPVQGAVAYLETFQFTFDRIPVVESGGSVVIAPGGTTVTFPTQYHLLPFVTGSVISSTALYVTFSNITTTTFDAHVWNNSGSDVGGTINWTSTGD